MRPGRDFADIVCMAFRPPLVGAPGIGSTAARCSPPTPTAPCATRYGEPVDRFNEADTAARRLDGITAAVANGTL